ncbi:MAG: multiheme c-type cytochrome [Terriglobia bacterium]
MPGTRSKFRRLYILLGVVLLALAAFPGASLYYEYSGGKSCIRCHEIWQPYTDWRTSTHRSVPCSGCHGEVFTLDAGFHLNNIHRLVAHLRGEVPERVRLKNEQLFQTVERCQKCHEEEYADWKAGPHSSTYARIFLDEKHNKKQLLMDDCLRCHGMNFDGAIRDLVTPISTSGPWKLLDPKLANRPAVPCLACHHTHHEGAPLEKPATRESVPGAAQEIERPSLGLFDRRSLEHIPLSRLPLPSMREDRRLLKISPDQRQSLCYQCHAPLATFQVRSGDDRTPIGIHEGISCLSCHSKHQQNTHASCSGCHPRMSNCGLDVEKMDTTFKDPKSRHDIHFAKCIECHPKGVRRRPRAVAAIPKTQSGALVARATPRPR